MNRDQYQAELWVLNNEELYHFARSHPSSRALKALFAECLAKGVVTDPIDLSKVNWKQVKQRVIE